MWLMGRPWIDGLVLLANACGFLGAVSLLVPFFREQHLKRIWADLKAARAGSPALRDLVLEAAREAGRRLSRFEPADQRWVIIGLVGLALSYSLNIVVWFLERAATGAAAP
ncbi:MAG: hypothetical protein EA405_00990 [Rhodospirillales bacterium]|nr:MAG: hypothetical protein EA405_00990 [Rhodospirillales bacterium]